MSLAVRPSGYKIRMVVWENRVWRLVGTVAEGLLCWLLPAPFLGGGKSEISKPLSVAVLTVPVFVAVL